MSFPFGIYLPIAPISQYNMTNRIGSGGSFNKKKPNRRVARLVKNGESDASLKSAVSLDNLDQKGSYPDSPYSRSPYSGNMTQCVGHVVDDKICFELPPNNAKVFCPFSFSHSIQHRVVLKINPFYGNVPFILNEVPFSFSGTEIDVTDHLSDGENHFIFNTMEVSYQVIASLEWRSVQGTSYFVQKIVSEFPPMEIPPENQFVTDICPISKKQIVIAARGAKCIHSQCFDLESFLIRAKETNSMECPLCGNQLSLNTLRHDPQFLKNCGANFLMDDIISGGDFF